MYINLKIKKLKINFKNREKNQIIFFKIEKIRKNNKIFFLNLKNSKE